MPAIRKSIPVEYGRDWGAFFEADVQAVLETRRDSTDWHCSLSDTERSFLMAWPILAYESISELAQTTRPHKSDFLTAYKLEPRFASELLRVVTAYYTVSPDSWTLGRAIVELDGRVPKEGCPCYFPPSGGRAPTRLFDWKEIAARIERECVHLGSLTGDRIRREAHVIRRKRERILAMWRDNFTARRGWTRWSGPERGGCLHWYEDCTVTLS